ncbi:MAG: FtsX-like permease family protein, partial [Acidobacteriota bacterium]
MELRLDLPTLAAAALLATLITAAAGLLPSWSVGSAAGDPSRVLGACAVGASRTGGPEGRRVAGALVVAEIALASTLLAACALALAQVADLRAFDLGFDETRRTTAKISLLAPSADPGAFFARAERILSELPELGAVGFASSMPTEGSFTGRWTLEAGRAEIETRWLVVSPGFLSAAGIELESGRNFDPGRDTLSAPLAAIVNRSFARRFLADGPALGRRLRPASEDGGPWAEVVGVVADTVMGPASGKRDAAAVYLSSTQRPRRAMALIAEGREGPPSESALRRALAAAHPRAISFDYRSLHSRVAARTWLYDLLAALFTLFAGASLVLAFGGVYGVTAAAARRLGPENAIRRALGATPGQLLAGLVRTSLRRLALGALAGAVLSAALVAATRSSPRLGPLLAGVLRSRHLDLGPWQLALGSWALGAAMVVGAGLLASLIPAMRALKKRPSEAEELRAA